MKYLDLSVLRILIVDDNRHMRSILVQILRSIGVRDIALAEDGADGFQQLKGTRVDMVLVDHLMAPITGTEFTSMVRNSADSPNPFVPIMMITGFADRRTIVNATNAGVSDIIVKPVSARIVLQRIADLILNPRGFVRTGQYFGPDRREGGGIVPGGGIGIDLTANLKMDSGERRRQSDGAASDQGTRDSRDQTELREAG